jgi:ssDNA thymidine ADP-ribosyltransferase, DarT
MTADRSALKRQHDHFQPLKMTIQLYHITHIRNLDSILRSGGLVSTARRLRRVDYPITRNQCR